MATSSERSPPPFPDSEEQDVLDTEEVTNRDTDTDDDDDGEDLFLSPVRLNEVVCKFPLAKLPVMVLT